MKKILLIVSILIGLISQTFADTGRVKWFNAEKGYGFIQPANGEPDVYIHASVVQEAGLVNLEEGMKLSYDVVKYNDRKSARNIKVIK